MVVNAMCRKSVSVLIVAVLLLVPVVTTGQSSLTPVMQSSTHHLSADGMGLLHGVPYVWQEINGFCNLAATSIVMQYEGAPLTLHDLFLLSGSGFSFAYIRYNDTLLMFPGVLFRQLEPVLFVCNMYGLSYTLYCSVNTPGIADQISALEALGINVGLLEGEQEAFDLVRQTIDSGHALIASVDPKWLPAADYDILRSENMTGGGHGVVIVGYNDTYGVATIMDPGVGSFGEQFGYPSDGRGNYTHISYTNLNKAWSERYYIAVLITGPAAPVEDKTALLGPYLRDMLLGAASVYAPGLASAYLWRFGEGAFRQMSKDITPQGLTSFLSVFDGMPNEVAFKSDLLFFIGLGVEAETTLQYLSFRSALDRVDEHLQGINLTQFIDAASQSLSHFEALSSNSSLIYPGNLTIQNGPLASLFREISQSYNATGDLASTLSTYETQLSQVSQHLLAIADSWRDAGMALAVYWPNDIWSQYGSVIIVVMAGVAVLVVVVLQWSRKRPSQ